MSAFTHPSRAVHLAAHITATEEQARNLSQVGNGIPARAFELMAAMNKATAYDDPTTGNIEGEVFIAIDREVIDEVIRIAQQSTYSNASKARHIEGLLGSMLYPQVVHLDSMGDVIITATDGDRGNA
jgi:hypothetical protein